MQNAIQRIQDLSPQERQELHDWLDNLDRITVTMVADDNKVTRLFFNDESDANSFVSIAEKAHNVKVAFVEAKPE